MNLSPTHTDIRGAHFISTQKYEHNENNNSNFHKRDLFWRDEIIITPKDSKQIHVFMVQKIQCTDCSEITTDVIQILRNYNAKLYMDKKNLLELKSHISKDKYDDIIEFDPKDEMKIDLLTVVGGDGSILWALMFFKNRVPPPVLGFGKGTVGFLCNFNLQSYKENVQTIMEHIEHKKPLLIEKRDRIQVDVINKKKGTSTTIHTLNELVIERGCNPHVIQVDAYVEGNFLTSYQGDGLIISTPTGSTAYSLAAGGPIINYLLPSLTMTPICSIKVTSKPLVISPNLNLTFKLGVNSRNNAFLNADGQISLPIDQDTEIHIKGSDYYVPLLLGDNQDSLANWIEHLRDLLGAKMGVAAFTQEKNRLVKL